jgi:hypothetical protein
MNMNLNTPKMKTAASSSKILFWLVFFSIAMGFMESAVVIYLRELYYPHGFNFPLQIIPANIARVEIFSEAATIIMLTGVAYLAGTSKLNRFAFFLVAFSVWDLFYYLFLYVFIGWPESLLTWDILFLIPFPWTGPVLAPCLVCAGLLILAGSILYFDQKTKVRLSSTQLFLLIGGCVVIITSFLWDYFVTIKTETAQFFPGKEGLLKELETYIPSSFNWLLFFAGLLISSTGAFLFIKQYSLQTSTSLSDHSIKNPLS